MVQGMTKKQKDQQEAIWEMLTTEATYISKLHVIKKVNCRFVAETVVSLRTLCPVDSI